MTLKIWGTEDVVRYGQTTDLGHQNNVVAALLNGGYVAGYVLGKVLYFQRYDGAGVKVGDPVPVAQGATQDGYDIQSIGADGTFAVSWNEISSPNSNVRSRVFDINGAPVGEAIPIANFGIAAGSDAPSIARAANGGYVTVFNNPDTGGGIRLSVRNADGVLTPYEITSGAGRRADVAEIAPNKFVVTYSYTSSGSSNTVGVKYKILDLSGTPVLGQEVDVGGNSGSTSDVIALKNSSGNPNGFAILSNNSKVLTLKFYDASGNAGASVQLTNLGNLSQDSEFFNATALRDGRVAVVYSAENGIDNGDIFVRIVNADGSFSDPQPLPLNSNAGTDGNSAQLTPSITELADGRLAVSWRDTTSAKGHVSTTIVDPRVAAVTVNGTAGNDVYAGSDHNGNQLNGNGGDDKLIGGQGSDLMNGGTGNDTASYERSDSGVTVSLAGGNGVGGHAAGDSYHEIENITGSQHGDNLTGNDVTNHLRGLGGDDILVGGGGADVLEGGAGNDTYYVDGSDTISEAAGGGIDTVVSSTSLSSTALANIENVIITGAGSVTIDGTGEANTINGNAGNDVLSGGGGNDSVNGGQGTDLLNGDAGNDSLYGGDGNDVLNGGADNDFLDGGDGNDILNGGVGNDLLNGWAGNDTIYGSLGTDVLTGGVGKDVFVFDTKANKTTNRDQITDFNVRDDSIYLETKYFGKLGKKGSLKKPAKIDKDFFKVGTKATEKDDYLVYNKKSGVLSYDADGSGRAKAVDIAVLKKGLALKYTDFFMI
jgi:hypothetical protein